MQTEIYCLVSLILIYFYQCLGIWNYWTIIQKKISIKFFFEFKTQIFTNGLKSFLDMIFSTLLSFILFRLWIHKRIDKIFSSDNKMKEFNTKRERKREKNIVICLNRFYFSSENINFFLYFFSYSFWIQIECQFNWFFYEYVYIIPVLLLYWLTIVNLVNVICEQGISDRKFYCLNQKFNFYIQ